MNNPALTALGITAHAPARSRAPEPDADTVTLIVARVYAEVMRRRGATLALSDVYALIPWAQRSSRRDAEIDEALATIALDRRYGLAVTVEGRGVWRVEISHGT